MNIADYSRKSKYTGKGESIGNQIEIAKKYISNNYGDDVHITVYEDEGFSGKNTKRPQFTKMMNDVKKGKIDVIVCYRLDRISRNIADFSNLITELNEYGVQFVSIKEQFDTSNPMGRAMMYIASVFSQLERETTAERIKDNFKELERTGRWLTGGIPTGYKKTRVEYMTNTGKKSSYAMLEVFPEEMEAVALIYENFKILKSINKVKYVLIEKGIKTRNNKYFGDRVIKGILRNPVYCIADKISHGYFKAHGGDICFSLEECDGKRGFVVYNRVDRTKKNTPNQDISEWTVALGMQDGIIDGKDWTEIQELLNCIENKYERGIEKPVGICNQLLKCSNCGSSMGAYRNGENAFYYVCNCKKRYGSSVCNSDNYNGKIIDQLVNQYMIDYMTCDHDIIKMLEKTKKIISKNEQSSELDILQKEISSKHKEIDILMTSLYHTDLTSSFIDHVSKKIALLDIELKELKKKFAISENKWESENLQTKYETLKNDLYTYKIDNIKLSVIEKRKILKSIIKQINYDKNKNEICIILKKVAQFN